MDDKNSSPETFSALPTDRTEVVTAPPADAPAPKRSRTRGWLIGGGAVLAAALLAGGGIALGAEIADAADEDDTTSSVSDDRSDDDSSDDASASGDVSNLGTDSADDLVAMIDAASAEEEGEPTSIDLKRDGSAEVTLEAADGAETEVLVTAGGEASVVSTESADDDGAPQNVLDADTIAEIVDAALAEADGRIVEIEADDDSTSPWNVTVLTDAGEFVELDLDAQFAVVATGTDTDD